MQPLVEMAPKTPQRHLTYAERARIHALRYNAGWKLSKIAQELKIPLPTVSRCARQPISPTKPHGRRRKLNTPIRRRLVEHATSSHTQRQKSFVQIASELNIKADKRTITKAFKDEGYYRHKATEKPMLTPQHMLNRLAWTRAAVQWPNDIWSRLVWSDECSFQLGHGQIYITRRAEEKYLSDCCVPKYKNFSCVMI